MHPCMISRSMRGAQLATCQPLANCRCGVFPYLTIASEVLGITHYMDFMLDEFSTNN